MNPLFIVFALWVIVALVISIYVCSFGGEGDD